MMNAGKRCKLPLLLAAAGAVLVQTPLVCAAAESAGDAPADRVDGAWQHRQVKFDFVGFTSSYNCEGLQSKVRQILVSIGARADASVRVGGCIGPNTPTHSAFVTADFYTVDGAAQAAAGAAVRAHWVPLEITPSRPDFMGDGDCELIQGMKDVILKNFSLRHVEYRTDCVPHQINLNGFKVAGETLRALGVDRP